MTELDSKIAAANFSDQHDTALAAQLPLTAEPLFLLTG